MQALKSQIASNQNTGEEKASSKREPTPPRGGLDILFARQRRLELRIERLEAATSTLRRDVFRVEKRQYREKETPAPESNVDKLPAGLFG